VKEDEKGRGGERRESWGVYLNASVRSIVEAVIVWGACTSTHRERRVVKSESVGRDEREYNVLVEPSRPCPIGSLHISLLVYLISIFVVPAHKLQY
jgi:hypothetical protein